MLKALRPTLQATPAPPTGLLVLTGLALVLDWFAFRTVDGLCKRTKFHAALFQVIQHRDKIAQAAA